MLSLYVLYISPFLKWHRMVSNHINGNAQVHHILSLVPFFPGTLCVFVLAVMVVLVLTVMLVFMLVLVLSVVVVPILDSVRHVVHAFAGTVGDGLAGSGNLAGW
jgi:hypothetical protein